MNREMKSETLQHIHFDCPILSQAETPLKYEVAKISAQVVDMTATAITEAINNAARQEGITDLYLMDKQFIFEAITEKMEREKLKNGIHRK